MILGKYKELIERVEVTDDMRCRILDHISREPIERPERILPLAGLRRYMAVAACFVILVAGAVMIPAVLHHNPSSPDQGVLTAPVLLNAASAVELSEMVGFDVVDVPSLMSASDKTTYMALGKELAEIKYNSGSQTVTFRKSAKMDDNSGDYNSYSTVKVITVNMDSVTLKGNDGNYNLAVWSKGEYSYSLHFTEMVTEEAVKQIVEEIDAR